MLLQSKHMAYWKRDSPDALASAAIVNGVKQQKQEEEEAVSRMTALEITVLVITFLTCIGQFVNLYFAVVNHQKIQKLVTAA